MRIAVTAPFEETVPPKKYGGTELVVYNLVEGLTRLGHEVTLFASGDSITSAQLKPVVRKALRLDEAIHSSKIRDAMKFVGVGKTLEGILAGDFDLVHNHTGWRLVPFLRSMGLPSVTTVHSPLDIDYQNMIFSQFPSAKFVSISNSQRKANLDLDFVATVYNGIEISKFEYSNVAEDYTCFLGRLSSEKGVKEAISIATGSGNKLVIAGKVDEVDKKYFTEEIEPNIDGRKVKFIGEVDHKGKVELLKGAKALLVPIKWEEPFGLVMPEAMACGTPVVAFKRGSVPEIVEDSVSGYVVDNVEQAINVLRKIEKIKRKDCLTRAKFFDTIKMVEGYVEVYKKVLK